MKRVDRSTIASRGKGRRIVLRSSRSARAKQLRSVVLGLERRLNQTQALQRIVADLTSELDLPRVLNRVVKGVVEVFEADKVAIFLRDAERFQLNASAGLTAEHLAVVAGGGGDLRDIWLGVTGPVLVADAYAPVADADLQRIAQWVGCRTALLLPLLFANDILGILVMFHSKPRDYRNEEVSIAFAFAHHLAIAIRNALSFERERGQEEALALKNRQLGALLRTSQYLVEGTNLGEQLSSIASTVSEVSGFRAISVLVVNEDAGTMELVAAVGGRDEGKAMPTTMGAQGALEKMFKEEFRLSNSYLVRRSPRVIDGSSSLYSRPSGGPLAFREKWHETDLLIVPLYLRDKRLVGMIAAADPADGRAPCEEVIQLLEIFAGQAAIAIRNARLFSRLKGALKAKDEFLAVVSHELRTPLTSITAYVQHLLQRLPGDDEHATMRAHLEVVNAQSRRMARLVQEVLDVSAVEKGNLVLDEAVIDLGDVVQGSLASAQAATISHRFVVEQPSPPIKVFADRTRIGQVVDDLLANAVKYSPGGGAIRVLLDVTPTEAVVSISDEGVGIGEEHIPYIFERFYQAEGNPRTRQFSGMGLGLYLSKVLVEAHGGRIWVESRKGQGSTFHFALPLQRGVTI